MKRDFVLSTAFSARIDAVALLSDARGPAFRNASELKAAQTALEVSTLQYDLPEIARAYSAFAGLVGIAAFLVDWRRATVEAESDADRFLRAAKANASNWREEFDNSGSLQALKEAAYLAEKAVSLSDVSAFCAALATIPLPIGFFSQRQGFRVPRRTDQEVPKEHAELEVAFLTFSVGGTPVSEVQHITPSEFHDLAIDVRVSRWPDGAESLTVQPVTIEPRSLYEIPTFELRRPNGPPPYALQAVGRLLVKVPQSITSRPLEFKYSAWFQPRHVEQPVAVVGQRTLRFEGIDLSTARLSGYKGVDRAILGIREHLRSTYGLEMDERTNLFLLTKVLGSLAGRCVQDGIFDSARSEADFQRMLRDELRRTPEVGSELEIHPHVGRGVTDLSFKGIRIELKFEGSKRLTMPDLEQYHEQTSSYVVSSGSRAGVLCVLDNSKKKTAPFPAEDGICLERLTESKIVLLKLLFQGNQARPSDLSK